MPKTTRFDAAEYPEFGTVMRIVWALGLTLSARRTAPGPKSKLRRVA
jgi:hypothetical protein